MKKYIKSTEGVSTIATYIVRTLYEEHPEIDFIGEGKTPRGTTLRFDLNKVKPEEFKNIIQTLFKKYLDRIEFGTSQYRNAPEIKYNTILVKKPNAIKSATNSCGIPVKPNVSKRIFESGDFDEYIDATSATDNTVWVVYMAAGKVKHIVSVFDTEQEAEDFCEEYDWKWVDENRFEWDLEYDWEYEDKIKSEVVESSTTITARKRDINIKTINDALYNEASKYMRSEGFYLDEIAEYLNIDVEDVGNGVYRAEVRAELSYDGMRKLAKKLDHIVAKYDKDAYFDDVDSGIIEAYIRTNT